MDPIRHLSKSRFTAGLQCHKLLWWQVHEPDAPELAADAAGQALLDQGTRVGELARCYVPGGRLVDLPYDAFEARIAATHRLLAERVPAIYEASFSADHVYAAVDILEHGTDGLHLIEVKSSTALKDEHLPDVAIQLHVLQRSGLAVARAELMHLNRECFYPHLEDLFVREDVTLPAQALQAALPAEIGAQLDVLAGDLPDIAPGAHCHRPRECPFFGRCRRVLPPNHVSTLYRVHRAGEDFIARGFETIGQLPAAELSPVQQRQRRAVRTGRPVVEPGLAGALRGFREPLGFLDFETVAPAVPVWDGCHPYESVPAQFSYHYLAGDGSLTHQEWIADGPADPRSEIARRLVAACSRPGAIVAYHASFERRCLDLLAKAVPPLQNELRAIADRLADLLPVVRDHVFHPDFGGSFGLKAVLPALVPGPGYEDLEVAEGATATAHLERLMFGTGDLEPDHRQHVRAALLRYCALDTGSLIALLHRLRELAGADP
jgi:hypothetical protein